MYAENGIGENRPPGKIPVLSILSSDRITSLTEICQRCGTQQYLSGELREQGKLFVADQLKAVSSTKLDRCLQRKQARDKMWLDYVKRNWKINEQELKKCARGAQVL